MQYEVDVLGGELHSAVGPDDFHRRTVDGCLPVRRWFSRIDSGLRESRESECSADKFALNGPKWTDLNSVAVRAEQGKSRQIFSAGEGSPEKPGGKRTLSIRF